MYSMETFLPYNLNKAERERDPKKVMTFGPFSLVLIEISIEGMRMRNNKLTSETFIYRGAQLPLKKFEEYLDLKNKNTRLELRGFTSTSLEKKIAFKFMFRGLSKDQVSILY